jgi:hypothetical protein
MPIYERYGIEEYSTFQYGAGTLETIAWIIDVDWDEDGSYDNVNEAPYCIGYNLQRGRQFFLASEGEGFEAFSPGRLTLTLLNTDGRYDPFNTSGPYYPNIDVGKFIKVQAIYDGTTYDRFAGIIEDIQPSRQGGIEVVRVTALDGWAWLENHFTAAPVEASKDSEDALADILTDADWPTIWGSSLGTGAETIGYWWEDYRTAAEAIKDITDFENGRFWIGADGSANYESRQTAGTLSVELTEEDLLKEIMLEMPWDAERNIVKIVGHPLADQGTQTIWTLQDTPQVAAGEYLELIVDFTYNDEPCAAYNLITPVENTDYDMNANADGSGADHSANFTVTIEATWGQRAKLKYLNNGGSASYITLGQLRASNVLTWTDAIESESDERSGSEQPRYFVIDSKHVQSSSNVPVLADYYGGYITMEKLFPTVRIENRYVEQFTPDILNRVGLDIPTKGIEDRSYRLGYIEERWLHPTGQAIETIFKFEPCEELGTYWTFPASMGVTTIFIY